MAAFAPVTIKEILVGTTGFPKITEHTILSIVATVTKVVRYEYKITYQLRDLTGKINAVFWLDENVPVEDIAVNTYVKVFGSVVIKEQDDCITKPLKELLAFKLMPISEIDAITCHYLQSFHKKHMDPYYYEKVLFKYIQNAETDPNNEIGIALTNIKKDLELQKIMSPNEIMQTMLKLWDSGYIHSTVDEEHFKNTAAFEDFSYESTFG